MKAVILAAGKGTRLLPLTADRPKCMVPLLGEPLLKYQISALRGCGIPDIAIVAGYQAERLKAYGCKLIVNKVYEHTNMVTSMFCAMQWTADEEVVLCYGDIVFEPRVLRTLLAAPAAPITTVIDAGWKTFWEARMSDPFEDLETLELGQHNQILSIGKRAKNYSEIQGQYIGLTRLAPGIMGRLYDSFRNLVARSVAREDISITALFQCLIDLGWAVYAAPVDHGWLELDRTEDLRLYTSLAASDNLRQFFDHRWLREVQSLKPETTEV